MYLGSVFFFEQKTAYEMRISDWSSDVCSSDLLVVQAAQRRMIAPADLAGDEEHAGVPRCRLQRHRRVEGEVFDSGQAIFPHDRVDCGGGGNRKPRKSAHCHRKMPLRQPSRMRSEWQTSETQALMRAPYAVCVLNKK